MVHIPFNGSPPAVIALQQGEAQVAFYTLGPITPLVRSSKVRVLAVAASARLPALPDAPTTAEAGFPDLLTGSWQAVAAPKGVDARILDRLNADFRAVLSNPAVRKRLEDIGTQAGDLVQAVAVFRLSGKPAGFSAPKPLAISGFGVGEGGPYDWRPCLPSPPT